MTLKQLRFLREIVRQSLNISAAASVLNASQPGVSRQIQLLEEELGVRLLNRRKNRIVGLTEAGGAVLAAARRLLNEADNISLIAEEAKKGARKLTLATSHLHARYTLLAPFKAFTRRHPEVQLLIFQADPDDIPRLVEQGDADLGISTSDETVESHPDIACLAGDTIRRSAIMLPDHPLAAKERLTLEDFAALPIVGYNPRSRAGQIIERAFIDRGIPLRFVMRANDSDVIKAYVAEGLGVGIIPTIAIDAQEKPSFRTVDVTDLLPQAHLSISIRRDMYLPAYLVAFVQLVAPRWDEASIRAALQERHPLMRT